MIINYELVTLPAQLSLDPKPPRPTDSVSPLWRAPGITLHPRQLYMPKALDKWSY